MSGAPTILMHNLQLTDDQTLILETVRKFVQDAVAPTALEHDEHRRFAREEFEGLAELGLFGLAVAEDQGGAGMGLLPLALACEEIGTVSGSLARLLAAQVQCAVVLARAGGGPLEAVLSGEQIAVFLGPEHRVQLESGKLRGTCELVPGAAEAQALVVAAHDGEQPVLCLVDGAAARRTPLRSLGLAAAAPARVSFDGTAAVPVAAGAEVDEAVHAGETCAWIAAGATATGLGRGSVELSHRHAGERIAFGKPLLRQQAVVRKLLESRRELDAARHLVFHAARLADLGEPAAAAAIAARIAAVDAAVRAADEGIQIHGGFGFTVEYHVERHYRDAKTLEVLDGGSSALRDRLAGLLFPA